MKELFVLVNKKSNFVKSIKRIVLTVKLVFKQQHPLRKKMKL